MSDKELAQGKLGAVGSYDLSFKEGKLVFSVSAGADGLSALMGLQADSNAVIDAICKAIPGSIDDALGNLLKAALKAV